MPTLTDNLDARIKAMPPRVIYNDLPSFLVGQTSTPETRRLADSLFDEIQTAKSYRPHKREQMRTDCHNIIQAGIRAIYFGGCVRYLRDSSKSSRTFRRAIECAKEAEFFWERRSPRGSPNSSRLIPLAKLRRHISSDPWEFNPPTSKQHVFLSTRGKYRQEIPFDFAHPVAADIQKRLELINSVNSQVRIEIECVDPFQPGSLVVRRLRPMHFARFSENWEKHGRLYTDGYGHQSFDEIARRAISFDGAPSIEKDFGGMHARMLYHLSGLPCPNDPYFLWGTETSPPGRLLAKAVVNAAINAATPDDAIAACNYATRVNTDKGERKRGKKLKTALDNLAALRKTRLTFAQIYELALRQHAPIARYFGSDKGIELMRIDSAIALDVLEHFARKGIPALGCHDSFIVPETCEKELCQVMDAFYRRRLHFSPVVK